MKRLILVAVVATACAAGVFCVPGKRPESLEKVKADVTVWFREYTAYSEAVIAGERTADPVYEAELTERMRLLNVRYAAARDR
jgi:hypothetical protein